MSAGVHNLDLASVSVDQLQAQVGPLDNLTLAGATAGRGRQLDTTATSDPIDVTVDAGIISVTLSLTPGVRLLADSLLLEGVNLALSQIGITTVDMARIQVGCP